LSLIKKTLEEISEELLEISTQLKDNNFNLSQEEKETILNAHKTLAANFGLLETLLNKIYSTDIQ
jgi:hypothetical protein